MYIWNVYIWNFCVCRVQWLALGLRDNNFRNLGVKTLLASVQRVDSGMACTSSTCTTDRVESGKSQELCHEVYNRFWVLVEWFLTPKNCKKWIASRYGLFYLGGEALDLGWVWELRRQCYILCISNVHVALFLPEPYLYWILEPFDNVNPYHHCQFSECTGNWTAVLFLLRGHFAADQLCDLIEAVFLHELNDKRVCCCFVFQFRFIHSLHYCDFKFVTCMRMYLWVSRTLNNYRLHNELRFLCDLDYWIA